MKHQFIPSFESSVYVTRALKMLRYMTDCDCSDGRDEPGTSACAGLSLKRNTKFYCSKTNSYIYSSRVNDGFCD